MSVLTWKSLRSLCALGIWFISCKSSEVSLNFVYTSRSVMSRLLTVFFALAVAGIAHPMGNFSINHYARIEVGAERTRLTYILDFAELPTLELLQEWDLADGNARALETKARQYAPRWLANLSLYKTENISYRRRALSRRK